MRKRRTVRAEDPERRSDRRDRVRVTRLLLCLTVFLAVFAGKRVWPSQAAEAGRRMLSLIRSDTDLRAAFASLGQALSAQESVLGELGEFCVSVFGAAPRQESELLSVDETVEVMHAGLYPIHAEQDELTARYLRLDELPEEFRLKRPEPEPDPPPEPEPQPEAGPPALHVGDVVQAVEFSGPELPERYTAQWLYLGEMETVTPVPGRITSGFGYRVHPTIGRNAVHGGVDIGADRGAAIACFADGTVADTGENGDFGKYLLVRHADGVESFYAHCSRICVKRGEEVHVGQKLAEVGSTGQATGPHLHFEIRLNGTRLDPAYYIAQNTV